MGLVNTSATLLFGWTIYKWLLTPPTLFVIMYGLWCIRRSIEQFKHVHETTGQFGDTLSLLAFAGGFGVIITAWFMWFIW